MNTSEPQADGRRWDSRGRLLAVGAMLLVALTLAYAGPAWLAAAHQLLSDGLLLLLWLIGAAGWGVVLLLAIRRPHQGESAVLLVVTAVALGLGAISLATLGLGLAGLLNRVVAFALPSAGILAGWLVVMRRWGESLRHVDEPLNRWLRGGAGWDWLLLLAVPLLAMVLVGAVLPPGMLWHPDEPHGYDVAEYHLQVPREWYESGRIEPLRHDVFSFFPFNVEVHYLLAMHLRGGPWKGMYLAQLMHVSYVVLAVAAVYGLAASCSGDRRTAPLTALAAAGVPWLALLAPLGYNEGGLLLYGTLAVGWVLLGLQTGRAALRQFAMGGAMAGFACGVKLTAVPMLLLAVPAAVVLVTPRRIVGAVVFGIVGTIVFAPWLARNLAWAHNPVFPEAASGLGRAHFSPGQVERWQAAHSPPPDQRAVGARLVAGWRQVVRNWQFGYVFLPLSLVAAALSWRSVQTRLLLLLLLMLAAFWLGLTHLQGRFFILAVPLAALLLAGARWRCWMAPVVIVGVVVGSCLVHRAFAGRLYGDPPWVQVLGTDDLSWLVAVGAEQVPADAPLALVGDARAFWYQRPMKLLRYRTVFDVDTSAAANVIDAWRGPGAAPANEWLLIDPAELRRFETTYRNIPPPPADVRARPQRFVVPPRR